ncbi:MAG: methyltransferase domain-containing protein [Caldilineaceae bacterium]
MATQYHQRQAAGTQWDPQQYLKFADHRLRPALELLDRVPLESPRLIYDLGCGGGQITRLIAERWPNAQVVGVDNSPQMLAQAAEEPSRIEWVEADVHNWSPAASPDLIYSNATLQWLDGHATLFPRLGEALAAGGCLAVQMPLSWGMPSHRLMRDTLADGGVAGQPLGTEALRQSMARKWVADAGDYYDLLAGRTSSLDIWETEYMQVLVGDDPIFEWVKGTGLRPILNSLEGQERETFVAEYTRRLRVAYPAKSDGRTLYPFRRLFLVATV